MSTPDLLAERYGRSTDPNRTRRWAMIALVALVVAGVAFVVWAAASRSRVNLSWTDLGVEEVSDASATVTFQLSLPPDRRATCTVRAVNQGLVEVGRRDVVVGPSQTGQVRTRVTLPTTQKASGGGVKACVLD
jgi:uncharacterized protein (DUF58 family)